MKSLSSTFIQSAPLRSAIRTALARLAGTVAACSGARLALLSGPPEGPERQAECLGHGLDRSAHVDITPDTVIELDYGQPGPGCLGLDRVDLANGGPNLALTCAGDGYWP
jgi:hypothetical protein